MRAHGRPRRGERGFTLIGVLVVIAILGILAGIVVFSVSGGGGKGPSASCATDYQTIQTAEQASRASTSVGASTDMDDLVHNGFLASASTHYTVVDGATSPAAPYSKYAIVPTAGSPCPYIPTSTITSYVPRQVSYPLRITQPDGSTAILKSPPTRIVTLDFPVFAVDYLVALGDGADVVGGATSLTGTGAGETDAAGVPVEDTPAEAAKFGLTGIPDSQWTSTNGGGSNDLSAVAALHPDLIVGDGGSSEANLKQLEAIAPVVSFSGSSPTAAPPTTIQGEPWYIGMFYLAQVLNREPEFQSFLTKFANVAASARSVLAGKSVADLVVLDNAVTAELYGPDYYAAIPLTYLGMKVEPAPNGAPYEKISVENMTEVTAPHWLLSTYATGVSQAFQDNPLVSAQPAIQAGWAAATANGEDKHAGCGANSYGSAAAACPTSGFADGSQGTPYRGFPSTGPLSMMLSFPLLARAFG